MEDGGLARPTGTRDVFCREVASYVSTATKFE
jgi:hypothetical protein